MTGIPLAELEALLQDGDMRASRYFTELGQQAGWPDGPLPARLQEAIDALDFGHAQALCRQLQSGAEPCK